MNISVDLHGVFDVDPQYWITLGEHIQKNGGKFYLLTGSTIKDAIKEIDALGEDLGIFTEILSTTDYLLNLGYEWNIDIHGRPSFSSHHWWNAKAYMAIEYEIDIHYDNEERYNTHIWPGGVGFGLYTKELITVTTGDRKW